MSSWIRPARVTRRMRTGATRDVTMTCGALLLALLIRGEPTSGVTRGPVQRNGQARIRRHGGGGRGMPKIRQVWLQAPAPHLVYSEP